MNSPWPPSGNLQWRTRIIKVFRQCATQALSNLTRKGLALYLDVRGYLTTAP